MIDLSSYAKDKYSQFGEDGIIEKIFDAIGEGSKTCVEFGASDGSCSNTRNLWEKDWKAVLIEGQTDLIDKLNSLANENCEVVNVYLNTGSASIDSVLLRLNVESVDFMSIDVDGIDYLIWESMVTRPRVVCIEYNQTIPPNVSIYQNNLEGHYGFGASARALCNLAETKGYGLIHLNKGNLFFVDKQEIEPFVELKLEEVFIYGDLSYIATDYSGRPFAMGTPPWGFNDDFFAGQVSGDSITYLGPYLDLVKVVEIIEKEPAIFIDQNWRCSPGAKTDIGVLAYKQLFGYHYPLIIIDVNNQPSENTSQWVVDIANRNGYTFTRIKGLMIFTRKSVI